jgi:hypothetical protein
MHHELWAGVDLKIENAQFHLNAMSGALQPPEPTSYTVILEGVTGNWHRALYAHFDAFLSASWSVPELIRCCFGVDPAWVMRRWYEDRDADERERRSEFQEKFKPDYDAFRALPLGTARNISEHRTGAPSVTVKVAGRFGVVYIGSPTNPIPASETREMPPELGWMAKPMPVRPMWTDFSIDGAPLFETCRNYLDRAQALTNRARALVQEVHGKNEITPPPSD